MSGPLRVEVIGGGPAGLYAARLLKLRHPDWRVHVTEQRDQGATFGYGIGLAAHTLQRMRDADPASHAALLAIGYELDTWELRLRGRSIRGGDNTSIGLSRAGMLRVLADHAIAAGVEVDWGRRADLDAAAGADLVVAADGVGSAARARLADDVGAHVEVGDLAYVWCGAAIVLDSMRFEVVETEHGVFVAHVMPYARGLCTFQVDTRMESLHNAGLALGAAGPDGTDARTIDYLSDAFADVLGGVRLDGNGSVWSAFQTVRCDRWSSGNVALLGDAAHTAHYSVGSGTRMAMEDALALADASIASADLPGALAAYEAARRPSVERLQTRALRSQAWWASVPERLHLPLPQLMVSYQTRTGAVTATALARADRPLVDAALAASATGDAVPPGATNGDVPQAILARPLRLLRTTLPSRLVTVDSDIVCEVDGDVDDVATTRADHADAVILARVDARQSGATELASRLIVAGADAVLLPSDLGDSGLLSRLDNAERIRFGGVPVAVGAEPGELDLASAGVLAGRADLVTIARGAARRGVVGYPADRVQQYRDLGYWRDGTIAAAIGDAAERFADRVAVVTTERRATYAELDRTTDLIAAGLLDLGLNPGDAVTLQLDNALETVEVWYALLKAGLLPVCTLSRHRHHEIDEIARLTGARAHIVQGDLPNFDGAAFAKELAARVPTVEHLLCTRRPLDGLVDITSLAATSTAADARQRVAQVQAAIAADDVAVLQLSGGTTARPKVIPRLHGEYLYNVRARADRWAVDGNDVFGYVLPLVHNAGIQTSLHLAHLLGAPLVLSDPIPDAFLPLFAREGVTRTVLPSGFAATLADHPDFEAMAQGLTCVALTLGKVPPSLFDRFTALGATVIQEFGMGEGLIMTHALDDAEAARRTTVGTPISPADEVRLVDDDGADVPPGTPGRLLTRGPYTICGYLDEADHNATAFTADGFYDTGDVMVAEIIDGRTYYRLEDRTKDLINRGGEKVNAAEVEALLLEHAAIVEAAVVAMPDERLGERACAFVVAKGAPPTLDDVRTHLAALDVAKFKWPERIEVVAELPRTAVGKLAKNQLRDQIRSVLEHEALTPGD